MPHTRLRNAAFSTLVTALLGCSTTLLAQAERPNADTVRVRRGSQVLIPIGSVFLPGLGQYIHGAPASGAAYTIVGVGGLLIPSPEYEGDFPRSGRDQLAEAAGDVAMSASFLSGWDAFHRAVPGMQRQGKYRFLPQKRERIGHLLLAPFDPRFLKRWTTWVDLGQTVAITALVLSERKGGVEYTQFRGNDAAYVGSGSMNAAVAEEAFFRGYLLPMLTQATGERFWIANGIQATTFGAAHLPDASWGALVIGSWALWEGWIVKRNDWSIRESIFHHFWYDVAVFSASMLVEERKPGTTAKLSFPPIRF